jgi:hypothetical protein
MLRALAIYPRARLRVFISCLGRLKRIAAGNLDINHEDASFERGALRALQYELSETKAGPRAYSVLLKNTGTALP